VVGLQLGFHLCASAQGRRCVLESGQHRLRPTDAPDDGHLHQPRLSPTSRESIGESVIGNRYEGRYSGPEEAREYLLATALTLTVLGEQVEPGSASGRIPGQYQPVAPRRHEDRDLSLDKPLDPVSHRAKPAGSRRRVRRPLR